MRGEWKSDVWAAVLFALMIALAVYARYFAR